MNETRSLPRSVKAAVAGTAVGGFAIGAIAFFSMGAWSTPIATTPADASGVGTPSAQANHTMSPMSAMATKTESSTIPMELSPNWAGPVVAGSLYDGVQTTFVVPQAKCSSRKGVTDASFWAGLDGAGVPGGSATVEQAGVRVACQGHTAEYLPWTEDYPTPEDDIDASQFSVAPGDTVSVQVLANATTDDYTLDDVTSGATFSRSSAVPPGATDDSAECIAEVPTSLSSGKLFKLTDFGTVTFSQCDAQVVSSASVDCQLVSGHGCPADSQVVYSSIGSRKHHTTKLRAETMSAQGGAFSVTWHHG